MSKRKTHPRLPNGYGSIKYLGKGRRNPYGVYPPVTSFNEDGKPGKVKALCYVENWYKGFAVLTAYKAGTYYPGMECDMPVNSEKEPDDLIDNILSDYNRYKGIVVEKKKTFAEIYDEYYSWKFEGIKQYSKSYQDTTSAAFQNFSELHQKYFVDLKHNDFQSIIDDGTKTYSSLEHMVNLIKQMYRFAVIQEYVSDDQSKYITINKEDDDIHGIPLSNDELEILWKSQNDEIAEMLLIMCYSGFRISAYKTLEINLDQNYFKGGIKTAAGKNRIVPIHSAILPLVKKRLKKQGELFPYTPAKFRSYMQDFIKANHMQDHTPHDCRHTFSMLCERYGVRENDRKRMLGHAFKDITNAVYGHRTIEELRAELEKIEVCC